MKEIVQEYTNLTFKLTIHKYIWYESSVPLGIEGIGITCNANHCLYNSNYYGGNFYTNK